MKLKKLLLIGIFVLSPVYGWLYNGHVLAGQIAYTQLTPKAKQTADHAAKLLYKNQPFFIQQLLMTYVSAGASLFAAESTLPDVWKRINTFVAYSLVGKTTLADIFGFYHTPVPPVLQPISQLYEGKLHYIDIDSKNPKKIYNPNVNVLQALTLLHKAYVQETNPKAKAIILIFIAHLTEDIAQPLHTMEIIVHGKPTYGGNKICVKKEGNHCVENLHFLWDSGIGQFSSPNIAKNGGFTKYAHTLTQKIHARVSQNPKKMVAESYAWHNQVTKPLTKITIQQNKRIALTQIVYGGKNLAYWMNFH